jgi:DNA polymerase-3 subunit alpha
MAGESKVKTITVDGESFEIVPLTEQEKNFRLNEISKKKNKIDFAKIPLDDKATWDLICSGLTKGVFQVEKQLGKRYCKEIKPRNINELSDVISLIRPGCLEAEFREKPDDPGKYSSITNTYIKVKNGTWEPEYIHECLEPILSETYSVPIYQEQIMRICTDFAGFTLKEADVARKAVGKKKADVMEKVKVKFLEGAKKNGHPEDLADTIFGWIEKFSGYGFNKSHGVSYALIAYKTAYAKAHRPNE